MSNNYGGRSKYLKDSNEKPKSKYLRDKNEKSKYLRTDKTAKSKYLRQANAPVEHHYNLTRNIREEEIINEEVIEEAAENIEAQEAETESAVLENNAIPIEEVNESNKNDESDSAQIISDEASQEAEIKPEEISDTAKDFSEPEKEQKAAQTARMNENAHRKSHSSSGYSHSGISKDTAVAHVENQEEALAKLIISRVIAMVILTVIACALQFATISPWFLPSIINVEFSVFPELIASIAYGPVFGLLIIVVKNIFHLFVANNGFVSELSNLVLDSIFVLTVGLFYSKKMFVVNKRTMKKKLNRNKRDKIFFGGLLGTVISTVVSFFLTNYVSYPLLIRQYSEKGLDAYYIVANYQNAINRINNYVPERISLTVTEIKNISEGILFFNVPITFAKFLFVTIVSALVYVIISPYLHFKKKSK